MNILQRKGKTLEERFWAKVDKLGEDDCWLWKGHVMKNGYGQVRANGKPTLVHRVSYEMSNETIKGRMVVDHTCYSRSCVNPKHLRLLTQEENLENKAPGKVKAASGYRGVYWDAPRKKWLSKCVYKYQQLHLGYFDDPYEAAIVALKKRLELFTYNSQDRKLAVEWGIEIPS